MTDFQPYTPPKGAFGPLDGITFYCDGCRTAWPVFEDKNGQLTPPLECAEKAKHCVACNPRAYGKKYRRGQKPKKRTKKKDNRFFNPADGLPSLKSGEFSAVYKMPDAAPVGFIVRGLEDVSDLQHMSGDVFRPSYRTSSKFDSMGLVISREKRESIIIRDHEGIAIKMRELEEFFLKPLKPFDVPTFLEALKEVRAFDRPLRLKLPGTTPFEDGFVVGNPPHKATFERLASTLKEPNIKTLYHGTYQRSLPAIIEEGFKCGVSGAFGPGIYLGETEKAVSFAKGGFAAPLKSAPWGPSVVPMVPRDSETLPQSRKRRKRKRERLEERYVVEVDVILGKSYVPQKDRSQISRTRERSYMKKMVRKGCLSVFYNGFNNPEWVVYNPHQILIKRILEVSRV